MNVRRFGDRESLDSALAERLKQAIQSASGIMLSGGHTPRPAYHALQTQTLSPTPGLHVLYSDERYVPPTSDASNYRASLPLLQALGSPAERVLRVRTELPLKDAAAAYEQRLLELLHANGQIAFGLLGLGADGHTAALFTLADLERARGRLAIAVQRPDGMQAVSVTPELLARIEQLLMVVVGAEKRVALAAFLARDPNLIAWQAVARCRNIELWCENEA